MQRQHVHFLSDRKKAVWVAEYEMHEAVFFLQIWQNSTEKSSCVAQIMCNFWRLKEDTGSSGFRDTLKL